MLTHGNSISISTFFVTISFNSFQYHLAFLQHPKANMNHNPIRTDAQHLSSFLHQTCTMYPTACNKRYSALHPGSYQCEAQCWKSHTWSREHCDSGEVGRYNLRERPLGFARAGGGETHVQLNFIQVKPCQVPWDLLLRS